MTQHMNKEFIDFLKSKISIVDVIANRVRLRRSGRDWFGLCPFHKEKTGSFKIDQDRGYYYCFGCGAHGDVITFVQDFEKISFSEAVEYLANLHGIPLPQKENVFVDPNRLTYDAMTEMKNWFAKQLNEPIGEEARQYLASRNISRESIDKFQIGFSPDNQELLKYLKKQGFQDDILLKTGVYNRSKYGNSMINRYNGRLIFPILNSIGKCVGFGGRILYSDEKSAKYINSPETEIYVKSDHLYGYFLAKRGKTREIILTEGYLDVISMHQAGFDGAVAPLGTSISDTQINMCWNVCDTPVISLDGDNAGIKASYRWIDKILSMVKAGKSFKFAKLPQGLDPDQLIADNQINVVREIIANAVPLSEWIWEGAFLLYPSETPEQKAAIVKMLIEKVEAIKDVSVKRLYIQTLRQKERGLYSVKPQKKIIKKESVSPVVSVREKLEKIFIVTLLNHPYIINDVIESFIKLEFCNFQMRKLKDRILDCYDFNGNMEEYNGAIISLKNEVISDLKDVELHAKFTHENSTDEEAKKGWFKMMDKYYSDPIIAADLQNVASSLQSTFSENDWKRLKALKREVISRSNKGEI